MDEVIDENELELKVEEEEEEEEDEKTLVPPRTLHEEELPPPEPLEAVRVDSVAPLEHIGSVWSVVDDCVVVQGKENARALIEGVVLCLEDRLPLGRIYEIFGPVKQPHYLLRVEKAQAPVKGAQAYVAESQASFVDANYVSTKRGCDASDMHDEELPAHLEDYSDDELESSKKPRKRTIGADVDEDESDDDSYDQDGPPSALLASYLLDPSAIHTIQQRNAVPTAVSSTPLAQSTAPPIVPQLTTRDTSVQAEESLPSPPLSAHVVHLKEDAPPPLDADDDAQLLRETTTSTTLLPAAADEEEAGRKNNES